MLAALSPIMQTETHLKPRAILALHYLVKRDGTADVAQVARSMGETKGAIRALLIAMKDIGLVQPIAMATWQVTSAGRVALALGTH